MARNRHWNWVQFVFGVSAGAAVNFLVLDAWSLSLPVHLIKVITVAGVSGFLAGRYGDRAWRWIISLVQT